MRRSSQVMMGVIVAGSVGALRASAGDGFPAVIPLSTLNGVDGVRFDAAALGDGNGRAVAAGDINGDGIDDMIIGAPSADPGGRASAGSVFVVFGRSADSPGGSLPAIVNLGALDGTNGFRLNGALAGDATGRAVACVGDMNGDGVDDLIATAPLADPNGLTLAGSVFVFFGRDTSGPGGAFPAAIELSALNGTDGFRMNSAFVVERCGNAAASAGDVNGDGVGDVIIGAESATMGGTAGGRAYVVFGRDTSTVGAFPAVMSLSTLNGANGFILNGANITEECGASVACAGDVSGDGFDDLLIGAPGADPGGIGGTGSVYVFYGRNAAGPGGAFPASFNLGMLNGINGFRFDGLETPAAAGHAVSSAGDLNGDGRLDLAIGAPIAAPGGVTTAGSVFIVYGLSGGAAFPAVMSLASINGTNGFRVNGVTSFEQVGHALAPAGDVNGDGIDDLIIGAPGQVSSSAGQAYVLFGRGGAAEGGAFPAAVSVGGLDGANGFKMIGFGFGEQTGDAVGAGDVNGDGAADVLVGAFQVNLTTGRSYAVYGRGGAPCPGDVTGDGEIGFADLNVVLADFNTSGAGLPGDTDGDGDVDFADLNTVVSAFNTVCP